MSNPFSITRAEGFNHHYDALASLMTLRAGIADILLNNSNVFVIGSRGSGKSMYLRLLSLPIKLTYERLAQAKKVDPLPAHAPYVGVYVKLDATVFSPHEYEGKERFREMFQQLFNLYCAEHIAFTLLEVVDSGQVITTEREQRSVARSLSEAILPPGKISDDLKYVAEAIHRERLSVLQQINTLPYQPDWRSQPTVLWDVAKAVGKIGAFSDARIHLLVDEFDSLSEFQQRILNTYLRKRDFPITFKIACKKHRLVLIDIQGKPLNPSGDFDPVELDDDQFGIGATFPSYLEKIANKRLASAGASINIQTLLGGAVAKHRPKTERRYHGFKMVAMLSSGIVRTFLELCRDMYALEADELGGSVSGKIRLETQDRVIKSHASARWNVLSRDQSARPELQKLIERIAALFQEKTQGSEKQIIRLEILDPDRLSPFFRILLDQALEYEALVLPNLHRVQKNKPHPSRGFVLNRLLCIHFRLEPASRWDVEISAEQLEALVLRYESPIADIARRPTKRTAKPKFKESNELFSLCPILQERCPSSDPQPGAGFLACRLPDAGRIRDSQDLIQRAFTKYSSQHGGISYVINTAENYAPAGDIACKVCGILARSEFVLVELSQLSQSVAMELGMAIARRLPTYILFNREEQLEIPDPWASLEYVPYSITPEDVERVVTEKIIPFLTDRDSSRGQIRLGPAALPADGGSGVFVAFPGTEYCQRTLVPKLREYLEKQDLSVRTEQEGRALHDLQRAAHGIAESEYCLIDVSLKSSTRALYVGLALGWRKKFAILIDRDRDPQGNIFTDGKSKAALEYRDSKELLKVVREFLKRQGMSL